MVNYLEVFLKLFSDVFHSFPAVNSEVFKVFYSSIICSALFL